jgi:uncharacterized membrane protein
MIIALIFHILGAVIWVGGMAFALFMLRPATMALEPLLRVALWRRVFARFFPTVAVCVVALLVSGYAMMFIEFGGFAGVSPAVNVMQALGLVMMLAFGHLYFAPWPRFRRAVDGGDVAAAAVQLLQIRFIVTVNLVLGIIVVMIGGTAWLGSGM